MSRMIKTSLVALSLLAGAFAGYAADNGGGGRNDGRPEGRIDAPDLREREEMKIDPNSTGSIQTCESQSYDEFGNCIVSPDIQ